MTHAVFTDGYYTVLNEPYDYTVNASCEQPNITKERILSIAKETNTQVADIKTLNGLLIGMEVNMNDLFGYFLIGFIIIGAIAILYLPIFFILKKRVPAIRQLCFLLFAGCAFIVLFATILLGVYDGITFRPAQQTINVIPFDWVREPWEMGTSKMITQLISNIIMFVPIGFFIPIVFAKARSFLKTALWIFVFTFFIEAFQYFTGRSADIDDIILNLSGGMLGHALFTLLSRCFQRKRWWLKALGSIK